MELQTILPGVDMQPHKPLAYFPSDLMKCGECGETVPFSEGDLIDRKFYCCVDCAENDGWITCDKCGDWFNEDDCQDVGCNTYCESCFDESYIVCECCGDIENQDSAHSVERAGWYCEDCFHDNYSYCGGCGEVVRNDDMIVSDYDVYCCECAPNPSGEQRNYILPTTFNKVGGVRYGVELEYTDACCSTEFDYFQNGTDHCGREFRSGILVGDGGLQAVRELAEYAENNDWDASYGLGSSNGCGYHLHLDCRGLSSDQLKSVAYAYHKSHKVWEACVHPDRENCSYANYGGLPSDAVSRLGAVCSECDFLTWTEGQGSRYKFVNWQAYGKQRSVEIRGHEGTCNANETCNWISAHTRFFDYVKDMSFADLDKLFCGMLNRDFTKWMGIVGGGIGEFYKDKADRHGNAVSDRPMVHNRVTPLCPI